ncbi:MAG: HAD family hydrolase [Alphaproteobacteria bacterium]|nr:HAD family hydrolase [Alphaproteobacteria bacterium]
MRFEASLNPDLVIFDCDGVLIDSEVVANAPIVQALAKLGARATLDDILKECVGISRPLATAKIEARFGVRVPGDFWDEVHAEAVKAWLTDLKAVDGVEAVVASLPRKCVASGSGPQTLRKTLGQVGLWDYFDPHIFSAHQVQRGKPAPDLFLFAAEQMGVDPVRCIVIEDSVPGVRAGRAANMRVLGFAGASHCREGHAEALLREGANRVFKTMDELGKALLT